MTISESNFTEPGTGEKICPTCHVGVESLDLCSFRGQIRELGVTADMLVTITEPDALKTSRTVHGMGADRQVRNLARFAQAQSDMLESQCLRYWLFRRGELTKHD